MGRQNLIPFVTEDQEGFSNRLTDHSVASLDDPVSHEDLGPQLLSLLSRRKEGLRNT